MLPWPALLSSTIFCTRYWVDDDVVAAEDVEDDELDDEEDDVPLLLVDDEVEVRLLDDKERSNNRRTRSVPLRNSMPVDVIDAFHSMPPRTTS